jgi:hypothetical protein
MLLSCQLIQALSTAWRGPPKDLGVTVGRVHPMCTPRPKFGPMLFEKLTQKQSFTHVWPTVVHSQALLPMEREVRLSGSLQANSRPASRSTLDWQHPLENRRTAAKALGKSLIQNEKPVATRFCTALQIAIG